MAQHDWAQDQLFVVAKPLRSTAQGEAAAFDGLKHQLLVLTGSQHDTTWINMDQHIQHAKEIRNKYTMIQNDISTNTPTKATN